MGSSSPTAGTLQGKAVSPARRRPSPVILLDMGDDGFKVLLEILIFGLLHIVAPHFDGLAHLRVVSSIQPCES